MKPFVYLLVSVVRTVSPLRLSSANDEAARAAAASLSELAKSMRERGVRLTRLDSRAPKSSCSTTPLFTATAT